MSHRNRINIDVPPELREDLALMASRRILSKTARPFLWALADKARELGPIRLFNLVKAGRVRITVEVI